MPDPRPLPAPRRSPFRWHFHEIPPEMQGEEGGSYLVNLCYKTVKGSYVLGYRVLTEGQWRLAERCGGVFALLRHERNALWREVVSPPSDTGGAQPYLFEGVSHGTQIPPRPLSSALARAAAAGECEARVPMEDPPPSEWEFLKLPGDGKSAWRPPRLRIVKVWDGPPLTPGEVVRAVCPFACPPCEACRGEPVRDGLECQWCDGLGHPICDDCDGAGPADFRILSVTPERGCETCGGEGEIIDGEHGNHPLSPDRFGPVPCPACHGEPPWRWWRVEFERAENHQ